MRCRYCNIALAPLRSLTDGEFCCDDHRHAFKEEQATKNEVSLQAPRLGSLLPLSVEFTIPEAEPPALVAKLETREFHPSIVKPALSGPGTAAGVWTPPLLDKLLALRFSYGPKDCPRKVRQELPNGLAFPTVAFVPRSRLDPVSIPVSAKPPSEPVTQAESQPSVRPDPEPLSSPEAVFRAESPSSNDDGGLSLPYREVANSWHWLCDAWKNAPSDLKIVTILLPILLAVAIGPAIPKIKRRVVTSHSRPAVAANLPAKSSNSVQSNSVQSNNGQSSSVQQVVAARWNDLHQSILNRAAVEFTDDFRSGLDAWDSHSNLTTSWSYDASGFVQPGPLAVFKPTTEMTDYHFQFLGEIDQKALGFAFRAVNLDNYYAVKLQVVKPGPLPLVRLVRYAVINGKEGRHMEKPLPINARPDTLYRISVDVRGSDFTVMAQGQVVDFWSDQSFPRGGVGFFCARGEKARIRWVEVSHQYDALGRLCAYLAPYGFEGRNGNWN